MEQSLGTGGGRVQTPPARETIRPYQSHRPPIHRQRYHMWYVSIPCTGVSYIWIFYIGYILKFYNQQSGLWGLSECTTDNICHHVLSENAIECNFERNRCNKLCHFERTQCMRCLPAQCEVLVPFYRLHPCEQYQNIYYTLTNFSMSTYFIHFEDYATT